MPRLRSNLVPLAAILAAVLASTSLLDVSAGSAYGSYNATRAGLIEEVPLTIVSAPINYDGDVAGKETHLVLMLPDAGDPRAPGLSVEQGGTITITLPPDFSRNAGQPIDVALPRWPQANVCCYSTSADGNIITLTFKTPVRSDGPFAPGLKVLGHIRGAYTNPHAGDYVIHAELRQSPDAPPLAASGTVHILETAPHARLAPTNLLLPKGGNANLQTVLAGQEVPALLSLLMWRDGKPLDGVGLMSPKTDLYARYTGGLLVREGNGDTAAPPAEEDVVGGVIISTPNGAEGHMVANVMDAKGEPILSGNLHAYVTQVPDSGAPTPGLFAARFRAGSLPGNYQVKFELIGGNSFEYTVQVTEP